MICWVLGEYGGLADIPVESVIDRLAAIVDTQTATDSVRGYLVTAFGKLCSQSGCPLTPQAQELLHDAINSRNLDLQQHALEIQTLLRYSAGPPTPCKLQLQHSAVPSRPAQLCAVLFARPSLQCWPPMTYFGDE